MCLTTAKWLGDLVMRLTRDGGIKKRSHAGDGVGVGPSMGFLFSFSFDAFKDGHVLGRTSSAFAMAFSRWRFQHLEDGDTARMAIFQP